MTIFDLSLFIGDNYWYEMYAHDVAILTTGCECIRCYQTLNNDKLTYNNEYNCRKRSPNNTHITTINATIYPNYINASEGGKMLETIDSSNKSEYWVLDQSNDYQYVLIYACLQTIPDVSKDDFVFFYSRNYTLFPDSLYQRWTAYLKSKNIDMDDVKPINQRDCW